MLPSRALRVCHARADGHPRGYAQFFYAAQPELETYRRVLEQLRRRAAHILSPECEKLLAAAGEMADAPDKIGVSSATRI